MNYSMDFYDRLACSRNEKERCVGQIASIVALSEKSRRMGLLILEDDIGQIDDAFLKKGLQLVVDGTDPDIVRSVLSALMLASGLRGADLLTAVITLEGILAIQSGDNPRIVADKLSAFLGADIDLWDSYWETAQENSFAMDALPAGNEDLKIHDADGASPSLDEANRETDVNAEVGGIDFEKLSEFHDRYIQKILREVDTQDLALALKGSSAEVQGAVFRNMSMRASSLLREDMDFMGPVLREDAVTAQEKILNIVLRLASAGEILMPGSGDIID